MRKSVILFSFLVCSLIARENPFEPTQTYKEEIERMIELENGHPLKEVQQQNIEETKKNDVVVEKTKEVEEKVLDNQKEIVKNEEKVDSSQDTKSDKQKTTENPKVVINDEKTNIKESLEEKTEEKNNTTSAQKVAIEIDKEEKPLKKPVPQKTTSVAKKYDYSKGVSQILPFISIDLGDEEIEIKTKYKVFRKFNIESQKKIVLDFRGDVEFYTRTKTLDSQIFNSLILGNHKPDKFFRIVVVVKEHPDKYIVTYNDEGLRVIKP